MSTDYFLACHECRKAIHVAQDGMSGFSFYSREQNCMKALSGFLEEHAHHSPQIISEHVLYDTEPEYSLVEWETSASEKQG